MSRCPIESPHDRVGEQLNDKWTLVRLLGVGGSSAVYSAVHRNGHRVAVKLLSNRGASAAARKLARQHATHESLLANAIEHPGVVMVLDDDITEDGTVYLVMELLEGETLEKMRQRLGGRVPLEQALPLLDQLLDVLAAAHDQGIVHRDIKPENVFVTASGQLKVLDFGLASLGREDQDHPRWFGTPGFMAPEQARGAATETDALTDLWAAAATFFVTLCGHLVHAGRTAEALVHAAVSSDIELAPLEIGTPVEVVDVLERALAFDKEDRWPSARAMRAALAGAAARAERQRRRRMVLPKVVPPPHCHSTTRIFRLEEASCGTTRSCKGIVCTLCPVCPMVVTDQVPAPRSDLARLPGARLAPALHRVRVGS